MNWSWTLYRYIARQFMIGVGILFAAFAFLSFSMLITSLVIVCF